MESIHGTVHECIHGDIMKKKKEYEEHVKECLTFAQHTADALLGQDDTELKKELMWSIFDKSCSPYHYFLKNDEREEPAPQPPTERQIAYAKQLGIINPESFTKQKLSEEIDKAKRQL